MFIIYILRPPDPPTWNNLTNCIRTLELNKYNLKTNDLYRLDKRYAT